MKTLWFIIISIVLMYQPLYANGKCASLFLEMNAIEIEQIIKELHELRLEMHSHRLMNSQLAMELFNIKFEELLKYLPKEEIENKLENLRLLDEEISPKKETQEIKSIEERGKELLLSLKLEIFLKEERFKGIERKNEQGDYPLHVAARDGKVDVIVALVNEGVKIDRPNIDGETAWVVASKNGAIQSVRTLLDLGLKVDKQDKDGNTALIYASEYGYTELGRLLLDGGARLDKKDRDGNTALMIAVKNDQEEIVELFLKRKANYKLKNKYGETALSIAEDNRLSDIEDKVTYIEKLLREAGARE